MELLRIIRWQRWVSFLVLVCAVLAFKRLDIPGYTRQFISKVNNDCRDFKGVLRKCHVWKDMGFCFKYRRQMQHVCNRTCQYCVPGQKQWKVIDVKEGVWGRLRDPASARVLSPAVQPKGPAVQILGKERAPQVDNAASAIATQLEDGMEHDISASPKVLGQLSKFHISLQNTLANATTNDETKGKLLTSQPVSPTGEKNRKTPPTTGPTISGRTQVSEQSKESHPVVVLMGYELGEKSSKRVHDVLKNADSDSGAKNNVGPQGEFTNDTLLTLRENSTSYVKTAQESTSTNRIPTEEIVPESDLEEIMDLLENAASASRRLRNNHDQYLHEETNERNADTNALQLTMHAPSLDRQAMNTLQSNATQDEGIQNADAISQISSDDSQNQQAFQSMTMHAQKDRPEINSTSMDNYTELRPSSSEGMPTDLSGMVAGNKHGNIYNPLVQMNGRFRKPAPLDSSGKQVTLTINEKPGTGEAVFKVQNSPHATGLSDTTEGTPGGLPPPSYLIQNENEEARTKSEEEETRIREATNAIKNVIKLFDRDSRHGHTRLVQQATQDFPGNSKSLEASRELTGIQSEYDAQVAQAQNQDRAGASAQALSQQIESGLNVNANGVGPGASPPNYAVVSTSDSKDWKNLAHVLATQLKHVLYHMEDREKENRYDKAKVQEEMMLMAQRQMMERDDDEGPDDDDDDDDDMSNRDKRRHFVLSPRSENGTKNIRLTDKKSYKTKLSRKFLEHNLIHRAVKKLSRLEILHKSKKQKRRQVK